MCKHLTLTLSAAKLEQFRKCIDCMMQLQQALKEIKATAKIKIDQALSEEMVRKYYDLDEYNGQDKLYDAVDKAGKHYEIKATSTAEGKTTMSVSATPDYVIWIYFDFENRQITIKKRAFDKERFLGKVEPVGTDCRKSVSLRDKFDENDKSVDIKTQVVKHKKPK
jgi:hypothetical protein